MCKLTQQQLQDLYGRIVTQYEQALVSYRAADTQVDREYFHGKRAALESVAILLLNLDKDLELNRVLSMPARN